jgi:hippurate hydrolase
MPIINRVAEFHDEMTAWRRDFHEHPELAFEEVRTAGVVAAKLREFGVDQVVEGVGRTGVVGVIKGRPGKGNIGLRADMDALPIVEATGKAWASKNPGRMHACGHDGHTTMLLGAAKYLAETRNFDGTVHVIFQPAEENFGGAKVMMDDGLFDRFPCDEVYGLHNMPQVPAGVFAWKKGPMMAAVSNITITVTGKGSHGAMPHMGIDTIAVAAQIVTALQTIVSRNMEPVEGGVVTIAMIAGGDTHNVIPEVVTMKGTTRWFSPAVGDLLEARVKALPPAIAAAFGATAEVIYDRMYPATVNPDTETDKAITVMQEISGEAKVMELPRPVMGGEDFAFMLNARPGNYVFLGGGTEGGKDAGVHHPLYDFNDAILPIGASYLARIAERLLKA